MKEINYKINDFKEGLFNSFPINLGLLPIAISFGVLAENSGFTSIESSLMSILVLAGSAQFMAISMLLVGVGSLEIIITTFIINFRNFITGWMGTLNLSH
jgi:predicted branched-subunit amino acid permease